MSDLKTPYCDASINATPGSVLPPPPYLADCPNYPEKSDGNLQAQYPPVINQYASPPPDVSPPPYEPEPYGNDDSAGIVNSNFHNSSDHVKSDSQVDVEAGVNDSSVDSYMRSILKFHDKSVRLGFIRKVFAILSMQMAVTIAMTALFLFHKPTKNYVQQSLGLYFGAYGVFFALYIVLVCCRNVARKHPINLILLALFTLSLSYLVAVISCFHKTNIVLAAFAMTILCTGAIIAFASQTKFDITACSGVLFCFCFSLLLFGIFAGVLVPLKYMKIVNVTYAALGALLFMGFLAYDIQTIMGGKKYELSPEEYVYAAMQLYVDVIYIFLFILRIFGFAGK